MSNKIHKKEKIYDEQISPLVKKIIEICKKEKIDTYMDFSIGDSAGDFVKTKINPNFDMKYRLLELISLCAVDGGVNIDNFLLAINKEYPNNESSHYMDKIFENGEWRKENKS